MTSDPGADSRQIQSRVHRIAVGHGRNCPRCGTPLEPQAMQVLTTEEVAQLLRRDPSTIRRWRSASPPQGPPFLPLSGHVTIYLLADIVQWLEENRIVPR